MSVIEKLQSPATNRGLQSGVLGGLVGSLAMAMYAMVSSTENHKGFFTPLYHIASAFISPKAMLASMGDAMHGNGAYFSLIPALFGAMVHMMTGAMAGGIFGALVTRIVSSRTFAVAAGGAFGMLLMGMNSFIVLPIVAHLFGGGQPISSMAKVVGWGDFTIEHLIFGLVLGFLFAARSPRAIDRPVRQ